MSKKISTQEKARRLWVRALRSGKYEWGKEELHPSNGKYCCLGVLCEVAIKAGIIDHYGPHRATLPPVVRDWAGLHTVYGDFFAPDSHVDNLSTVNDESRRNPFIKIANMIESKPTGLFVEESE